MRKPLKKVCRGDQVQCGAGGVNGMALTTADAVLLEMLAVGGDAGAIGRMVGGGGDDPPALDLKGECSVCHT